MRQWLRGLLAVAPIAAGLWAGSGAAGAAEGGQDVDAWVTVGSTNPAVSCVVDASVEVRGAGGPVTNLDVVLGLVVDGEIVDVLRGVTDEAGIALIDIDMSEAYPEADTRLEVNLAGTYADRLDLSPTEDGPCSGAGTMLTTGAEIWLPAAAPRSDDEAPSVVDAADALDADGAEGSGSGTFLADVPLYKQQRNLSCEYAALSIATGTLGGWVSEYEFDGLVGWSQNPHWGFRGDINGQWGNTTDYGVYPEALVGPLAEFSYSGEVIYGADDPSALTGALDAGAPVLVWIGLWGDTSFYESLDDGTTFKLASGYHVAVAYGYDEWGVYLSDPGLGGYRSFDWSTFMTMWNVMDGMALAVSAA